MAKLSSGECIRQLYQAIQKKDLRAVERVAGDAQFTEVPFNTTTTVAEDLQGWFRAFPDSRPEVMTMVEQGDKVVVEGIVRGTHTGILQIPQGDINPTGRRLMLPYIEIYEVKDGRIRSGRMYFDVFDLLKQLGVGEMAGAGAQHSPM